MEGLSLRAIARKFGVSKEAVRKWILKFEQAFARRKLSRKKGREMQFLLDETKGEAKWQDGIHLYLP
jgi:transposase